MLEEQGIDKNTLSRQEFLGHAWRWKEKYGNVIIQQLKSLDALVIGKEKDSQWMRIFHSCFGRLCEIIRKRIDL